MKKRVLILGALLLLVGAAALWADNSLFWPIPTPGSPPFLQQGDLIYASDANHLGNITAVPKGSVLCSNGVGVQPIYCNNLVNANLTTPTLTDPIIPADAATVAPAGPGVKGIQLRARPGTTLGTCKLVAAAGAGFGEVTVADNIPAGAIPC